MAPLFSTDTHLLIGQVSLVTRSSLNSLSSASLMTISYIVTASMSLELYQDPHHVNGTDVPFSSRRVSIREPVLRAEPTALPRLTSAGDDIQ